ncbi:MAG: hypothetical protein Kow0056_16720 [Coriobacteriia bacterium]
MLVVGVFAGSPLTALAAGPPTEPLVILSEDFEWSGPSDPGYPEYLTIEKVPWAVPPSPAMWGTLTNKKLTGSRSLWCAASGGMNFYPKYPTGLMTRATFDLTSTVDYYSTEVSFWYLTPSLGVADEYSFSTYWRYEGLDHPTASHHLPGRVSTWRNEEFSLTDPSDDVNLSREAGTFTLRFYDFREGYGQYPTTGEGTYVDLLSIKGYKYGPVTDLLAGQFGSAVKLDWSKPPRATDDATPEERPHTYRVWRAPGTEEPFDWTEVTPSRLDTSTFVDTTAQVGMWYTYLVQAWDEGEGTGYGVPATTTVQVVPTMSLAITATPQPVLTGHPVTVQYQVTNLTGDPLIDVTVEDDSLGVIGVVDLVPYGSATVETTTAFAQTTALSASATTVDQESGTTLIAFGSGEVRVISPSVSIEKSADSTAVASWDAGVTYTYRVTNTGDVPLSEVAISDDLLGTIASGVSLGVGEHFTVATSTVLATTTTNVATVTGVDSVLLSPVNDTDSETVTVYTPSVSVVKTASSYKVAPSSVVTYTYTVSNTGDAPLTSVVVEDDQLGVVDIVPVLLPGETVTRQASTTLLDDTTNVVTATGTFGSPGQRFYGQVTGTDSVWVDVEVPGISVSVQPEPRWVMVGDTVTYTYTVTNTGNFELADVRVDDSILGNILQGATLQPEESVVATTTDVVNGTRTHVATAEGRYGGPSDIVSDADTATVTAYASISPSVSIEKSPDATAVAAWDSEVTYTYTITNTGDVPLADVTVSDDRLGEVASGLFLEAGATSVVSTSSVLATTTTNVATVTALDVVRDNLVQDADSAKVSVFHPDVRLLKSTEASVVVSGDDVTYTFEVSNTGDAPLRDLVIADDALGVVASGLELEVGESYVVTQSATALEDSSSTATVTATYGTSGLRFFGQVSDTASTFVDVIHPAISITKSADATAVASWDTGITYTYHVANTGDVPLVGVTVSDDKLGTIVGGLALDVGEEFTTATSTVISVTTTNVATASGVDAVLSRPTSDTDTETVSVFSPAIAMVKTASAYDVMPSEPVTYTYAVSNTGDAPLTSVVIEDDQLGVIDIVSVLLPGDTVTRQASTTLLDDTTNIATVIGTFGSPGQRFYGQVDDTKSVFVNVHRPGIEVWKYADPEVVREGKNETVTYTYQVLNSGEDPLTDVKLEDDVLGTIVDGLSLQPGQWHVVSKTATVNVTTTNVVEATGRYGGPSDLVTSTAYATVTAVNPSVSLEKSSSWPDGNEGQPITYTYKVTNDGDVRLEGLTVVDDKLGEIGTIASLGPGKSSSLAVTTSLEDDTTNVATVTAQYYRGPLAEPGYVSDWDEVSVVVHNGGFELTVSANKNNVQPGTSVTLTYTLQNTGEYPIDGLVVRDNWGTVPFPSYLPVSTTKYQEERTVTVSDDLMVTVEGTGTAQYLWTTETDSDSVFVNVVGNEPSVSLSKSADATVVASGDTVTYTYTVTNDGEVPLENVTVVDSHLGTIASGVSLLDGQQQTFTRAAVLTTTTTNVATVTATPQGGGSEVIDTAAETVTVYSPSIQLTKSASAYAVAPSSVVTYTYSVKNTGDVALSNVVVEDDKLGVIDTIPTLSPGQTVVRQEATTLLADTTNVATATATYGVSGQPFYGQVTDSDSVSVDVLVPDISVDIAAPNAVLRDDDVTYTYTVTNSGESTLTDVLVEDDQLGVVLSGETLAPGAEVTTQTTVPLGSTRTNTATASGRYGGPGEVVTDTDSVTVSAISPAVTITKSANTTQVAEGGTVTYTYTVRNTGDVTLVDLAVGDDMLGEVFSGISLDPGEQHQQTKQAQLSTTTTNVATVTGRDALLSTPVSDTDTATVVVRHPSVSVTKTAEPMYVLAGTSVTYTYVVGNTGDVPLSDVTIDDDVLGQVAVVPSLAPGETATRQASQALDDDTTNVVTVTGTYGVPGQPFFGQVQDTDSVAVSVATPDISVTVSADKTTVTPGTSVTFTYTIENTGDTAIEGITVVDDWGALNPVSSLAPGAQVTRTRTRTLDSDVTVHVTVAGTDSDFDSPVSHSDSISVTVRKDEIERVAGTNRIATAIEMSKKAFGPGEADTVVVATAFGWADALPAAALAGAVDGPLLLVEQNALPSAVRSEIVRLGASHAYIVGGFGVVSDSVKGAIDAIPGMSTPTRLGGTNRYATARLVALEVQKVRGSDPEKVFLATGRDFPDALAASSIAAAAKWPILLTDRDSLPTDTRKALESLGMSQIVVCGGEGVVGNAANQAAAYAPYIRKGGTNRYETAEKLVRWGEVALNVPDPTGAFAATGANYPDALAGGPLAGGVGGNQWRPLLLTDPNTLSSNVRGYLRDNPSISYIGVLGGPGAVSDAVYDALEYELTR